MNKIFAISSTGQTLKSFLDLRFGKCDNLIIFNTDNGEHSFMDNPFKNSDYSGVQLVKFLKQKGVSIIITGEVGPKVSEILEKEKLQLVLLHEEKIKIEDIISRISAENN